MQQIPVQFLGWEDPRDRLPTPVFLGFPCGSAHKESACNVGDLSSIPGLGRSPGKGNSYPLQYTGLENSMDWIVQGVAKIQTWLSNFHFLCKSPLTWWFETIPIFIHISWGQTPKCVPLGMLEGVSRTAYFLDAPGKNLFSCLFQLLKATHIPWLMSLTSILQASSAASLNLSLTSTLLPPCFLTRTPLIKSRPPW